MPAGTDAVFEVDILFWPVSFSWRKYIEYLFTKIFFYDASEETISLLKVPSLPKKRSFPLRSSSVDVTKSAVHGGFGQIYWKNP